MPPDERVVQQAIEGQRAELAEKTKLFLAELQKGMEGNAEDETTLSCKERAVGQTYFDQ